MSILFGKSHTLKVYSNNHYENGWLIKDQSTESTIIADVQPMTGEEINNLNIGRENVGKIKIYYNDELNITKEGTDIIGDIVEWNGEDYELIAKLNYDNNLINHYKYIGELRP